MTMSTPLPDAALRAATETCSTAATIVIRVTYRAPSSSQPLEVAFIEGWLQFVSGCRDSAIAAERDFFASVGLPHEATSVGKRFDAVLAELRHRLDLLRNGHRIPMPVVPGTEPQSGNASVLSSLFIVRLLSTV